MPFKVAWLKIEKGLELKNQGRSIHYSLTMDTTDCTAKDIEAARLGGEGLLDKWLNEFAGQRRISSKPPAQPAAVSQADRPHEVPDIADLNALPWKGKNKVPSKAGEWGWILSDPNKHTEDCYQVVKTLNDTLRILQGQALDMGEVVFCFSGDKKQFIHRRPKNQEKAT